MVAVPSTHVNTEDINIGPAQLYYYPTPMASLSAANSQANWARLGYIPDGLTLALTQEELKMYSGMPAKIIKRFVTTSELRLTGALAEMNGLNISRLLGIAPTTTVKVSPSTTIATGTTASQLKVASSTGFAAGDEIGIGAASPHEIGVIEQIVDATTIKLLQPLPSAPAVSTAVKKIDKIVVPVGLNNIPQSVALKLVATWEKATMEVILFKAQSLGNFETAFVDNGGTQVQQAGFSFEALSVNTVENGALGVFQFAPND